MAGDVIEVRHGLARNKLIPNRWAVPATRPNIERFGRRVQVNVHYFQVSSMSEMTGTCRRLYYFNHEKLMA